MEEEADENERKRQVYVGIDVSEDKFNDWGDHALKLGLDVLPMEDVDTLLNNSFLCTDHYCGLPKNIWVPGVLFFYSSILMVSYEPNDQFPFDQMSLADPQALQGGSYFSRLSINSSAVVVQFPECGTKEGVVKTARSKYVDLAYPTDMSGGLAQWLERFESSIKGKVLERKASWFSNEISEGDLDSMLNPMSRTLLTKKRLLIRAQIDVEKRTGKNKCLAYDEQEREVALDDLTKDDSIIPLVTVEGIKFTSRSFDIEVKVTQVMRMDKKTLPTCRIKRGGANEEKETFAEAERQEDKLEKIVLEVGDPQVGAGEATEDDVTEISLDAHSLGSEPTESDAGSVYDEDGRPALEIADSVEIEDIEDVTEGGLVEVDPEIKDTTEGITLKKPQEVYYEIYKAARERAKQMRQAAIEAFLEAKQIKEKYMLRDLDDSESEGDSQLNGSFPSATY